MIIIIDPWIHGSLYIIHHYFVMFDVAILPFIRRCHDQHEDPFEHQLGDFSKSFSAEFHHPPSPFPRVLSKNNELNSQYTHLRSISHRFWNFPWIFPKMFPSTAGPIWVSAPRVACFPGSPVAGLCTEEAVTTTRAVGDKLGSILEMGNLLP